MATEQLGEIVIAPRVLEKLLPLQRLKWMAFTLSQIKACLIALQNVL